MLSALFARLCPGLPVGVTSLSPTDVSCVEFVGVLAIEECWVAVGVEPPVEMLADESVRPAARLYRPGEALTGASSKESERSGMVVDNVMPVKSPIGLMSLSSFEACASERLEEPDVDTVESDEDDGWDGWPRRACCLWLGGCC